MIAHRDLPPLEEEVGSEEDIRESKDSSIEPQDTVPKPKGYDRYEDFDYPNYLRRGPKPSIEKLPENRKRLQDESGKKQLISSDSHPTNDVPSSNSRLDPTVHSLLVPRGNEWIARASEEHHQRCHQGIQIPEHHRCPPKDDMQFRRWNDEHPATGTEATCPSITNYALRAIMLNAPLKPFLDPPRIVPLASVTGRNKSRNQDVDVLVVVESIDVSTTKPARLPLKRDIRIKDPSVDDSVTLSIFMDPENFRSSIGTVALLRHVTTHDWRRGNLNAYPARVKDKEWFIPNPVCLGLRESVQHMEQWWKSPVPRKVDAGGVHPLENT